MKTIYELETKTEKKDRCEYLIMRHQYCIRFISETINWNKEEGYNMPIIHLERALVAHKKAVTKLQAIHLKILSNE